MPSIPVQAVMRRTSILLQDEDGIRWQPDELLDWLTDGQLEYVRLRPDAYVRNINFTLRAGAKQQLPEDGVALIDVLCNKNGTAVREVARRALDAQLRDWASAARAKPIVVHFCYSKANPKVFHVYPPSPGGNVVEMAYHALPPALTSTGVLAVDDSAIPALIDYLAFRALSKDSEYADTQRAAQHYQAFLNAATGALPSPPSPDA